MTIVNKVIHRFVRPRYDYMSPEGELYSQIIPVNTQAYSYECVDETNPNNPNSYIIRYVLGTGGSTYAQIAEGRGKDKDGNIIPELSKEFVLRSDPQLIKLIIQLIKEQVVFTSYLTSDSNNNPFATKAALDAAEEYYVSGELVTPKLNDYTIVLSDESRPTGSGEYPTTRYVCVDIVNNKPVWAFQYQINNGNFTPEQQAAIDSGITTEKVALYDSWEDKIAQALDHIANNNNPHNVTKEQIGLGNVDNTSDLDKPVSSATQEALDILKELINYHVGNSDIHVTAAEKETWNRKQDALKMGNHIQIKNDVITVLDDLSTYDNRASGFVNKDVDDLYNYYTKAELDKYLVGGTYKYSGEVATYEDLPFSLIEVDEAYYKLLWVNANRLQYIDTKYKCNQDTKISIKVRLNRGNNYLYSTKMNEANKVGLAVNYGANTGVAYFGNKEIQLNIANLKDTETEIVLSKAGVFVDGEKVGNFGEVEDFTTESTLFVPKWNSPDTHSMNLDVFGFQISKDNIVLNDFIPVVRKYDEVPGLYDKLTKKFYRSELKSEDETIIVDFNAGEYESSVVSGTVYKVRDENRFYMWYKNRWINVAELHTAGIGISIDKDGTINNIDDIIINGESQFDAHRIADLTEHFDKKVDKTKKPNRIYGTDDKGRQTTYDKEDFGKVDDVLVDEVSVVENKIAHINLTGKVDKTEDSLKIYGTDEDGNQVVYDKEDFGKVDDVRLNGVSVVGIKEEKVADIDLVAADSEYHNDAVSSITNVQQALDTLMNFHYYKAPTGTFDVSKITNGMQVEIGTVIQQPFTLSWNLTNRTLEAVDVCYYKLPGDSTQHTVSVVPGSYVYTQNLTSNTPNDSKTFSFYYKDNHTVKPTATSTDTFTGSETVYFRSKMYFGVSTKASLTDEEIRALSSTWCSSQSSIVDYQKTSGSQKGLYGPFTNTNKFYVYLVFPTAYCTAGTGIKFTEGFETNDYQLTQRNVETSTGLTNIQYNIYRFHANDAYPAGSTTSILIEKR